MPKKRPSTRRPQLLTEQLRHEIEAAGVSRYRIAKETGVPAPCLCRFVHGQHGLSNDSIDRLGEYLGLEIVKRKGK